MMLGDNNFADERNPRPGRAAGPVGEAMVFDDPRAAGWLDEGEEQPACDLASYWRRAI